MNSVPTRHALAAYIAREPAFDRVARRRLLASWERAGRPRCVECRTAMFIPGRTCGWCVGRFDELGHERQLALPLEGHA